MNNAELEKDLASVLNRHNVESQSDTPDFILARFLVRCLDAFTGPVRRRDSWYGHSKVRNDTSFGLDPGEKLESN